MSRGKMIPKESVGGLRIPLGRVLGIFPRFHKAALFLNFDEQPRDDDKKSEYTGDITVHGHTMFLGTCCDGILTIDWNGDSIRFESSCKSAEFIGHFNSAKRKISGVVTLRGVDNLNCEELPICFEEFE